VNETKVRLAFERWYGSAKPNEIAMSLAWKAFFAGVKWASKQPRRKSTGGVGK
jgi:hypothetical protein